MTILITAAQSYGYLRATINADAVYSPGLFFTFSSMIIIVAGTMFCMWLGERITDKGIGNGISMLIMIGIVSRFPAAIFQEIQSKGMGGLLT